MHSLHCVKDSSIAIENCNYTLIGAALCSVFDVQCWQGPEWLRTPKLPCVLPSSEIIAESCLAELKAPPKLGSIVY